RRINTASVNELTNVGFNFHALVIQEENHEWFSGIRPWGFGFEADVGPLTRRFLCPGKNWIWTLFFLGEDKKRETYTDGGFAAAYVLGGRYRVVNKNWLCSGEIMDEFLGARFGHNFIKAGEPLSGGRVVSRMRHNKLAAIFGFNYVFERLGRCGSFDIFLVINHAEENVAVAGAKDWIDGVFRKSLKRRRVVFHQGAFLGH